jgi:hypothetical protein
MTANLLEITARNREDPFMTADPTDFDFWAGPPIDPQVVLTNPMISLYCLDHANRRALFVETPAGIDLSQAPFLYQTQYEHAKNAIAIPYDTFHRLADGISLDDDRIILVYSTGRAGSTLLGAALNAAEGIIGLSEPDVFTQLVAYREWDGTNEAVISRLVESCLKFQCQPTEQNPHPEGWAVKFRSFSLELGDLLFKNFPNTKNVFLYRHAEPWLNSMMRAFGGQDENDIGFRIGIQGWLSTLNPPIARHVQANGPLLTLASMASMTWIHSIESYLALHNMGMPGMAFRYEDLKAAPNETLQKVFEYCGLSTANMEMVYQVLEKDSQAGSAVAQDAVAQKKYILTDEHLADLSRLLKAHPAIQSPDFLVPATWLPPTITA